MTWGRPAAANADDEVLSAADVRALRERLAEAEATLDALRQGEVDAVIVEGDDGPRIYSLEGVDAESNRFRGEILANVSDAVVALDDGDRIIYLNAACEKLYGVRAEWVLGRRVSDMYVEQGLKPSLAASHADTLQRTGEWRADLVHVLPDGRQVVVEVRRTAFHDGKQTGTLSVIRDISDRIEDQLALRESEERLRLALEAASMATWDWDAATNFTTWNDQHFVMLGLDPERHVPGYDVWLSRIHPDDRRATEERFVSSLQTGDEFHAEYRVLGASDAVRWVEVHGSSQRSGSSVRSYGIMLDVTDRRVSEQALRDADRRKDEFLATLAHELRNPLAPVRNAVHILQMVATNDPTIQRSTAMIDRQVLQMTRLIDELMDVSRVNQGMVTLRREIVLLRDVINSAVETSRPVIDDGAHALEVRLPEGDVHVNVDPTRLSQIILNLLNNAAKYTPHGGRITLVVEIEGRNLVVSVSDNGIGLGAESLRSVFGMFSQVQSALSRSHGGLGIGLYLVRRLVEMHDGTIEAFSGGEGLGSKFIFRLPVVTLGDEPVIGTPVPRAAGNGRRSLRILVVDDNADMAESMAQLLTLAGHETRLAHDGAAVIAIATDFHPDAIVLDIGLPGMSGYDVARSVRRLPHGGSITLIAVTGWGQDDDRNKAREAGFDRHIVKPVDPERLIDALRQLS